MIYFLTLFASLWVVSETTKEIYKYLYTSNKGYLIKNIEELVLALISMFLSFIFIFNS